MRPRPAATVLAVLAALTVPACGGRRTGRQAGHGEVDQVHLLIDGDPRTRVRVEWHTTRSVHAVAELTDPGAGTGAGAGGRRRAVDASSPSPAPTGPGRWYSAVFDGLRPGQTYRYTLTGVGGASPEYHFATAPAAGAPVRFDAFADQGDCRTYPAACAVIAGIAADRPAFVLGGGDLTYANEHGAAAADRWLDDIAPWATSAPLAPTPGNHEWQEKGDSINNYKGRFDPDPTGPGDYYSFDAGPVHVVALPETYVDMAPGTAFARWLEDDLAAADRDPAVRWKVAFGHRPFFSTGTTHGPSPIYVQNVLPVLERFKVDLVISGHEHQYERTLPMRGTAPAATDAGTIAQGTGPVFVVTGGGGAEIYEDQGPAAPWDATRALVHEHLRVDADGTQLQVTAIDRHGRTIDSFVIRRPTS